MTKLPLPPRLPIKGGEPHEEAYEYSTKELKPAALVLKDLLRAHTTFLLHHGSSLSALFVRSRRSKFVALLGRYWDLFLSTWNVMLHGNPAREIFGGINVAASGELGVGVGEEDRGSGEREVLEGLVGRIEGLVDLVVSRFGSDELHQGSKKLDNGESEPWLGSGKEPEAEDGAIFLGTGALSRKSLVHVTHWMEDLYTWGEHAYGIIDSPTSTRRRKPAKITRANIKEQTPKEDSEAGTASAEQSANVESTDGQPANAKDANPLEVPGANPDGALDKMVSILKLGYGSYWTLPGGSGGSASESSAKANPASTEQSTPGSQETPSSANPDPLLSATSLNEAAGHFLIGLKGEIEEEIASDAELDHESEDDGADSNPRTLLRTVHIELESTGETRTEGTIVKDFEHPASHLTQSQVVGNMLPGYSSHDLNKAEKLRVVVYVNKPFIFTFLFQLRTDSLAMGALYRSLHYQLAPLRKPLLASTSYRPDRLDTGGPTTSSINDLVWDPPGLTVHCTIPNIPDPHAEPSQSWSRTDAINTHLHILSIRSTSSTKDGELERTQKTSRGWWIVWTRLIQRQAEDHSTSPHSLSAVQECAASTSSADSHESPHEKDDNINHHDHDRKHGYGKGSNSSSRGSNSRSSSPSRTVEKEIFLIRRASDHVGFRVPAGEVVGGGGDGVGRLAHGIGVDTRRYIEQLLSLL